MFIHAFELSFSDKRHLRLPVGVPSCQLFQEIELGSMELVPSEQHIICVDCLSLSSNLFVSGVHLIFPLVKSAQVILNLLCFDSIDSSFHLLIVALASIKSKPFCLKPCMDIVKFFDLCLKVHLKCD